MGSPARLLFAPAMLLAAGSAPAADCPCPPAPTPGWHGNAGAGLSITDGNSDTQSYNLSLALTWDPQKRDVVKIDGLYLRSRTSGVNTTNRSAFGAREERKLGRAFLFGEARYERDHFKQLDYLLSPIAGAGYKAVSDAKVVLSLDAGVGLAIEKLEERASTTDAALRAGQNLSWRLSDTASLTEASRALWKVKDFADAFYHVEGGLAASISHRLELKLAALVDVKNKPASATLKKTEKALLASLVLKF